jgi:hypothetical protein
VSLKNLAFYSVHFQIGFSFYPDFFLIGLLILSRLFSFHINDALIAVHATGFDPKLCCIEIL